MMSISDSDEEFDLLDSLEDPDLSHERSTATIVTRDAYEAGSHSHMPQYGLLAALISSQSSNPNSHEDRRVYLNTNSPFTAVVCGVQGSGKSHTVGVMLESMLIQDRRLGRLEKPLMGLVLHFGEGGGAAQPCEAAYQAISSDPSVNTPNVVVYVSPSSLNTMTALYAAKFGASVAVLPLSFTDEELDAHAMLSMMAVSDKEPPLYIHIILNILKELGENFSFAEFERQVEAKKDDLNPGQRVGLEQRMSLLKSFLQVGPLDRPRFQTSQLTIIDLTDPFINAASACSIFDIVTRLFVRAPIETGKFLLIDEAHKYLHGRGSAPLVTSILSMVRQQRHLGMRIIISTQEPTVIPPVIIQLCSLTMMHRFSARMWFDHLTKHLSSDFTDAAFDTLVRLQTGQAILLAPKGMDAVPKLDGSLNRKLENLGRGFLVVKIRKRLTVDGGASELVIS